jgi:hypothetical protein
MSGTEHNPLHYHQDVIRIADNDKRDYIYKSWNND